MPTLNEKIASNDTEIAEFANSFSLADANSLAEDLKKNSSLQQLLLESCRLDDTKFQIIAKGLIDRKLPLHILNLNYNYLTELSIPVMKTLIEKGLVNKILIYANYDIFDIKNTDIFHDLVEAAAAKKAQICNINPRSMKKEYPNFFAVIKPTRIDNQKPIDENKEGTAEQNFRPGLNGSASTI